MPAASLTPHPEIILAGGVSAFDLTPAQNAIRIQYGRNYHRMDAALWDVAALWGIAPEHERINQHGVFAPVDEVIRLEAGRSVAEIELARAPSGLWAVATDYHLPNSGAGSAPSVWNRHAFRSRDDARTVAVFTLRERMQMIAQRGGSDGSAARSMITEIDASRAEQMQLF